MKNIETFRENKYIAFSFLYLVNLMKNNIFTDTLSTYTIICFAIIGKN